MNENGLPASGKIVVFSPGVAARAAEHAPGFAERIFTVPGLPEDKAYVIDLDAVAARLRDSRGEA